MRDFDRDSYHMPRCNCPACGYELDMATNAFGKERPKRGDATVCLRCGNVMVFRKNLTVRSLTDEERERVKKDPRVQKVLATRAIIFKPKLH